MKVIYQCQQKGCGYACVKMLASRCLKNKDIDGAVEPEIGEAAPSLKELIQYGRGFGISLAAYRFSSFEECFRFRPAPFLAVIGFGELSHMVVVEKKVGRFVFYLDPSEGRSAMRLRRFSDLFEGIAIYSIPLLSISTKNGLKHTRKKRGWIALLPVVANLLPGFVFALRVLLNDFLTESTRLIFSLVGVALVGVEVLAIAVSLRSFDRKYLDELLLLSYPKRKAGFECYYRYREELITGRCAALTGLEASFCLFLYWIQNVSILTPLVGSLLLIALLVLVLDIVAEKALENQTEKSEAAFVYERKENCLPTRLKKVRLQSRFFAGIRLLFYSLCLLLSGCLAILGHRGEGILWDGLLFFFFLLQTRSSLSSLSIFKRVKQEEARFRFFFPERSERNIKQTKPKKGKILL